MGHIYHRNARGREVPSCSQCLVGDGKIYKCPFGWCKSIPLCDAHKDALDSRGLKFRCSEGDNVPNHPLYKAMEKISNSLAQGIISRMPEYDRLPWE